MTHDFHNFSAPSPYYKGLLNQATSPDRESVATTTVSSGSRMSFYVKIPEFGCFKFKAKDEKPPTMVKVYSTESSNDQESLRERGSEPTSPQFSPPVQPPLPPPVLSVSPTKKVAVTAKDDDAIESKDGMKYIWADRYRPLTLKDFICNKDKAIELQKTIKDDECRHFIFEGQAGVGKRTMIWALLRDVYGADKVQGEEVSSIIVNVKESSQHVEVNLSELKGFEKHVIVELIKEANMLTDKARCNKDNCRDKLSTDALLYIRWVIERYRGCHKVFFCCQDASKLQHLQNICTLIKFLPPSNKEIVEVLELIARKEKIELPRQLAERIAINSKNNLRQAIRSFEASWHHKFGFILLIQRQMHMYMGICIHIYASLLEEDPIILTGWEDDIAYIAKSIVEKQNPKQLYLIRQKLQNLIDHSVPPEFIFEVRKIESMYHIHDSSSCINSLMFLFTDSRS
uniref:Putative DNA polymerase III, clamp loader complex, gamma/delta/delta subunit n=1 Tax=Helianthus annuus TaxID=4232 RepID=A0A251V1R0_HELAN